MACASLALASERASALRRCGASEAVSNPLGTLWARPRRLRRPPGCDASAAPACHSTVVVRSLGSAISELVDDGDRPAGWGPCVCGVHAWRTGGPHSRRSRDIPSRSAEPTGAVKTRPTGPSAASREAGALTVAGRWSYAVLPLGLAA
jgi:hypothetical protein